MNYNYTYTFICNKDQLATNIGDVGATRYGTDGQITEAIVTDIKRLDDTNCEVTLEFRQNNTSGEQSTTKE